MTKDEALDLALEALESCSTGHITDGGRQWHDEKLVDKAITAIKQARALDKMAEDARELGLDYEPAKYSDIVSDGGMDPRNQFDVPPTAQPSPVQEPVAWIADTKRGYNTVGYECKKVNALPHGTMLYTTPPAAKRQWVGLTEQERNDIEDYCEMIVGKPAFEAIEAKLRSKNNG